MTQEALRRFDTSATDLTHRCHADFEAGGAVADQEIHALAGLAEAIGRGLVEWRDLTTAMALAQPLDARRAGVIVLETVFDEVLAPDAWRVLSDAFALTRLDAPVSSSGRIRVDDELCP